jgi:hypothetical protein
MVVGWEKGEYLSISLLLQSGLASCTCANVAQACSMIV